MTKKPEYNHELFRTMRAIAGEIADTPGPESHLVIREAADDALCDLDSFFDGELHGEARSKYLLSLEGNKTEAEAFAATHSAISALSRDRKATPAGVIDRSQNILDRYELRRTYLGPGAPRRGAGHRRLFAAALAISAGAAAMVGGYAFVRSGGSAISGEYASANPEIPSVSETPINQVNQTAPEHMAIRHVASESQPTREAEYRRRMDEQVRSAVMAATPKMVWTPENGGLVASASGPSSEFGVEATFEPARAFTDAIWLSTTDNSGSVLWSITPLEDHIPIPFQTAEMLSERRESAAMERVFLD